MSWRPMVLPVVLGTLAAGMSWAVGVVALDAILIGVLVAALVGVPRRLGYPAGEELPEHPDDDSRRGYYEVRRLAGMFRRDSGGDPFHRLIVPRLRELCERRLAAAGMRPDDEAAREILGADVFDWLNGRPSRLESRSRVKQAEVVLDRLDEHLGKDTESGRV